MIFQNGRRLYANKKEFMHRSVLSQNTQTRHQRDKKINFSYPAGIQLFKSKHRL